MRATGRTSVRFNTTVLACVLAVAAGIAASSGADDAVARARDAAKGNRHEESIAAFRDAFEAAPERRADWLVEYADQHTWAGRLPEAIELYREATTLSDPQSRRYARIGLARALSWQGRHSRALSEYRAVLAAHPDDRDAALGAARVQSWRGRHRDAVERIETYLVEHPHDREAVFILAESLSWMGRGDRAEGVLRAHLQSDAGDTRASRMLAQLEERQGFESRFDVRGFDQSDDLRISEAAFGARTTLLDGRAAIGSRYIATKYRPPAGSGSEIDVRRPGMDGRFRFNDALEWHGSLFVDLIDTRGAEGDYQHATYETYVAWWPADVLRVDAGASRWTFDSEPALRAGLTAEQLNASVDFTPDDRMRLSLRASTADFSDRNQREWAQFEAQYRVIQHPRVVLGYRFTDFDFSLPGRDGYYNPGRYESHEGTLQASGWMGQGTYWELRVTGGRETDAPGVSRGIHGASALLAWPVRPGLYLEAALDHSSSRTTSVSGFERSVARLGFRYSAGAAR
jgi:tetratricopeptide (TPR) repeat protein